MSAKTPWLTSDDLVDSVKKNILFPISQSTFTSDDILNFANKEMMTSQVPSILQYHEEYYVHTEDIPLLPNTSLYPIPERAIGLKLRDLYYRDSSGTLTEMTRITGDEDIFTYGSGSGTPPYKYKLQGNDIVLVPTIGSGPTGNLVFTYYFRPNQLVPNARAAIISSFTETITVNNASIVVGDKVSITSLDSLLVPTVVTFIAGTDFAIGVTSTDTASNLVTAINTNGIVSAANTANIITLTFSKLSTSVSTSNSAGFVILATTGIQFTTLPASYLNPNTGLTSDLFIPGVIIDFLQTRPGHKTKEYSVQIPLNGISNTTIEFNPSDVPSDLVVGDYICLENECIIPQMPSDLHEILSERTSARIQRALGDQAGLQATQGKVQEMEQGQSKLIDNRTEGTPQKIVGRHTLLKIMSRRRSHLRGW